MTKGQKKAETPAQAALGQNTVSGQRLLTYVERLERLRAERKAIGGDIALVNAEAKAEGFSPAMIGLVVKRREAKPHDVADHDNMRDMYLHACGMLPETPLERLISGMTADTAARDSVIEAMKRFVPQNGSITVESDGKPFKLTRDKSGEVTVSEVVEQPVQKASGRPSPTSAPKAPVPDVDDTGAELLGGEAFKANEPIVKNPFPFGDSRRQAFDKGWRDASGQDGFGQD